MGRITGSHWRAWSNEGPPSSGTAGTLAGEIEAGGFLHDVTNGVFYVNEGSKLSPYYTPLPYGQAPLFGVHNDFRDRVGTALADTTMGVVLAGSGLRVFGQGHADTDSGCVAQTAGEGGVEARITTTNEAAHLIALGMEAGVMQPDQHKLLVVDCEFSNVTAITLRGMAIGFIGTAADALDPAVTCATTVCTLVQDDLALLHFNVGYTDPDRWYIGHNKSNENASMTAVDTSTNVPAAGTYQRARVEISAAGAGKFFLDKVQVGSIAAVLDADEECSPVFYLESTDATTKSADIRRFAAWAYR